MDYNKDYIAILVCDNVPNQKFWSSQLNDWVSNIDEASVYLEYRDVMELIWKIIPEEKATHRITASNITLYKFFSSGKWDGIGPIPKD